MSFQSFRASLDSATSRRLMYVLFAGQAVVVGSIMYQQRHGNPVKVARDEHGVMRFQSLREYLTDEIKVRLATQKVARCMARPHADGSLGTDGGDSAEGEPRRRGPAV